MPQSLKKTTTAVAKKDATPTPLTSEDRTLADAVFVHGSMAPFTEVGMSHAAAEAFLSRKEIRDYLGRLNLEYAGQESMLARARYAARRDLQRLAPRAVQTLADALRGPVYMRGAEGEILFDLKENPLVTELPPTMGQREAATQVLDRLGIGPRPEASGQPINLASLLNQATDGAVELDYGDGMTEYQKALTRERVRTFIDRLKESGVMEDGFAKVLEMFGGGDPQLVKGKKKKVVSKTVEASSNGKNGTPAK